MADSSKDSSKAPGGTENETFSVNPIPATAGLGNPIHLAPGEKVPDPSTITSNTVASTVKLDEASYENADAGAASQVKPEGDLMSVPPVQKGMIPESSLPMGPGTAAGGDAGPFISSVGAQSTTAQLAGQQPIEPRVPAVVSESQAEAHAAPEASANAEAVAEKAEVEAELVKKVQEEPAAAESSTTGAGAGKADAAAPQKENAKPEASAAATKKKRRSVFIDKIKSLVKRGKGDKGGD